MVKRFQSTSDFQGVLLGREPVDHVTPVVAAQEGGGGGAPEWVPEGAKIHIDLLGGTPQGRAYVDGVGEVAVDTLLGSNAVLESRWAPTGYDPELLGADGYDGTGDSLAFTGALATAFLAGATGAIRLKTAAGGGTTSIMYFGESESGLAYDIKTDLGDIDAGSYLGSYFIENVDDVLNMGDGSVNGFAWTAVPTRSDFAWNGDAGARTDALATDDWPTAADVFVTVGIDPGANIIQFITVYDALPDTTGLSALSVVA